MEYTDFNAFPEVERKYKDTVFRMLFRGKSELLSLYNAVNGTNFTNAEDLEITTLENAVYMGMKNDVSCVFAFELCLYEHQSTVNPNMPLRDLFYVAQMLQKIATEKNLYSSRRLQIPTPRFAVFYNGSARIPEKSEYRLSELFHKKTERPELELIVTVYNINPGMNEELLEGCRLLKEYMLFTTKIRENRKNMDLRTAVNKAVDDCIREGILAEFLKAQRGEVIAMSIFEYDQEKHMKMLKEEEHAAGFSEGRKAGLAEGHKAGLAEGLIEGRVEGNTEGRAEEKKRMLQLLQQMGNNNELHLVDKLQDEAFLEQMYKKYGIPE